MRTTRLLAGLIAAMMIMPAFAQLSTATLTGRVSAGDEPAKAGVEVIATNTDTGFTYRTATRGDGSYVLTGVAPGRYEIRVAGGQLKSEVISLAVGERASVDFAIGAAAAGVALEEVTIVGSTYRKDVQSSEVATNVPRELIETLPQTSRNFLAFADLAPGVRFNVASDTGHVKVQSGAQSADNVNVFIDGVSQKNYILRGGISGMDSSRGNPFPQSAVSEYKVISQNYKAEFDQVSSVAITAVTRSGTNEWEVDTFWDRISDEWVAESPFEKKAEENGVVRPEFSQDQYGATLGGPIVKDRVHFFVAYEGKRIEEPRQVVLQNANLLPNAGIVPQLRA
ncbi:MAG: carboxypeptidase regulatory-like domain-containing protein, partial [Steroidobacteraceae bacterium]